MKTLTRFHTSYVLCLVAAAVGLVGWTVVSAQDSKPEPKETPAVVTDDPTPAPTPPAPVAPRNTVRLGERLIPPPTAQAPIDPATAAPPTAVYEQPVTAQATPGFVEVVPVVDPTTGRTQYVARSRNQKPGKYASPPLGLSAVNVDGYGILPVPYGYAQPDQQLELQSHGILHKLKNVNDAQRKPIIDELTTLVTTHFEARQKAREAELKRLEEQLKELRTLHERREALRAEIIGDRVRQMVRESEGLGWGGAGPGGGSGELVQPAPRPRYTETTPSVRSIPTLPREDGKK